MDNLSSLVSILESKGFVVRFNTWTDGFVVKLGHGYEVSVMYGAGNYCHPYLRQDGANELSDLYQAEIALIHSVAGKRERYCNIKGSTGGAVGWISADDILVRIKGWAKRYGKRP